MSSVEAQARTTGRQVTHSTTFEVLTRLGFIARGVVYATIGLLAIQVAMHATRQSTDQRGAMETIQNQPFGHWLLIAVAIGLGAYACWRFVQAFVGYGPEGGGDHSTFGRVAAAASGVAYTVLCGLLELLLDEPSRIDTASRHRTV